MIWLAIIGIDARSRFLVQPRRGCLYAYDLPQVVPVAIHVKALQVFSAEPIYIHLNG